MLIDATNREEIKKYEMLKKQLISEKMEKGKYDAGDIVLVRAAGHLPVDNQLFSLSNVPFVVKQNDLACETMVSFFEDLGKSYIEIKEIVDEMSPLSTHYRSSIHFCLNGIVSSHAYGNFDDYPFVIIEPFKNHEYDSNILSVRGEDTYFENKMTLSSDAKILVNEEYADKILEARIDPNKVVFYRGERDKAVEMMLIGMNIVPERIGDNYIIQSDTSSLITNFIKEKNYPLEKHCFSESYNQDHTKTVHLMDKYAKDFYTHFYNCVYGSIEGKEEEIEYLSTVEPFSITAKEHLKGMIKNIGLERYKEIVDTYNSSILEKVKIGQYPTNNQILEGAPFGYSNSTIHK